MTNDYIADRFIRFKRLLELSDANSFKIRQVEQVADIIEKASIPLEKADLKQIERELGSFKKQAPSILSIVKGELFT